MENKELKKTKFCFLISHIGEKDTPERIDADRKLKHLFDPTFRELKYNFKRADDESTPGFISTQIIKRLIDSEMVISDISFENVNVFYELAVRHAVKKPVIIIKKPGQKPPFDITDIRAIDVDMTDPDVWQAAKKKLEEYIVEAEKDPQKASESILSNFTKAFNLQSREDKESDTLRTVKDIQSQLNRLNSDVKDIKREIPKSPLSPYTDYGKNPDPFQIRNFSKYVLPCKNCNYVFEAKYNPPSGSKKYTEQCPSCGQRRKYDRSDYAPLF